MSASGSLGISSVLLFRHKNILLIIMSGEFAVLIYSIVNGRLKVS